MAAGDDAWRELDSVASRFARMSIGVAGDAVRRKPPNSADLVGRLLEVASVLLLLLADGARATADVRVREQRQLIETKNGFVRMTAHELRRPIGVLNGYLSMLLDGTYGELPEKVRTAVERISVGAQEMANLVDGLVTIAQLEDRDDALRLAPYRLGEIVVEAVAVVEAERAAKHISVQPHISSPDDEMDVDADLLRIAIVNLLSNAIKYGSEWATVTVATHQEADKTTVTVTDQGPGIDPAVADSLFAAWQRGAGATIPGLGLGLYIVREIVDMHRGGLELRSVPGQGSTFTITLPRREAIRIGGTAS